MAESDAGIRAGSGAAARPAPLRIAPPRGRRRPGLLALGTVLVVIGALASVWLVNTAGERSAVLVAARMIPAGQRITPEDLATAQVRVDPPVAVILASEVDAVVGLVAGSTLPPGVLLSRDQLRPAGPPAAGQALVAVAVPATRMPASGLQAGDQVLIVSTPPADADPPTAPPSTIAADVVRVGDPDLNGVRVLDVVVAGNDGPALAARAATGRVAVVVKPRKP